jgi:hypothetical protein
LKPAVAIPAAAIFVTTASGESPGMVESPKMQKWKIPFSPGVFGRCIPRGQVSYSKDSARFDFNGRYRARKQYEKPRKAQTR